MGKIAEGEETCGTKNDSGHRKGGGWGCQGLGGKGLNAVARAGVHPRRGGIPSHGGVSAAKGRSSQKSA